MPTLEAPEPSDAPPKPVLTFPLISRDHILHCSYDAWFPKYRAACIRSLIIPLTPEFVNYLREDGIILASENSKRTPENNGDDDDDDWTPQSTAFARPAQDSADDSESDSEGEAPAKIPPDQRFPALHARISSAIQELGGAVAPKLNWSSPQDAAWILPHQNTPKCTTANDVYLLLKSSSFISHDLEHAFDGTIDDSSSSAASGLGFQPVLVLRSFFDINPALEFRCFVKQRTLIAVSQRDLNYFDFLTDLKSLIIRRIDDLFESKLRTTFPDGDFVFDVYLPEDSEGAEKLGRARLIDINAWAARTDSLLFGWNELLEWKVSNPLFGTSASTSTIRIPIGGADESMDDGMSTEGEYDEDEDGDESEEAEQEPELRLIEQADAAAFNFSGTRFSAHKLPKDVVDASGAGPDGLREFAAQWNQVMGR